MVSVEWSSWELIRLCRHPSIRTLLWSDCSLRTSWASLSSSRGCYLIIALFGCGGRLVYLQARLQRSALAVFMKKDHSVQSSRLKYVSIEVVF